ncbi:hypothetical protein GmHk_14G040838 [Glycine max]|nr:hypothetical protein GmHk_14G040838 [Glycine max]
MFIDGLRPQTKKLLDASTGGKIKLKTPEEATELIENMSVSDHAILRDRTHQPTKKSLLELSSHDTLLAQNKLQVVPSMVRFMKQANVFPSKKTLKKFILWGINNDKGILKEDFQAFSRVPIINKDSGGHTLVTMSNHKSTELALKNLEVQVEQLAKQIVDKSSNSFVANTEQNPKEECKDVMTRSKRFVEAEDEESVVYNEKVAEKESTEVKKNDGTGVEVPYLVVPSKKEKDRHLARFLDIFKKLEITMPFREALQQIPFAKCQLRAKRIFGHAQSRESQALSAQPLHLRLIWFAKLAKMASRKHKSIGSRPTMQYDTRRFSSLDAWTKYTNNVLGRNILPERKVEIYHSQLDEFKAELERRNFHKRLTNLVDGSIDLALVKEFYANLYSSEDHPPKQPKVRGHLVKIDADSLNTFLETPVVLAEGETLSAYSRYYRLPTDYRKIEASLCIPGRGFILNSEGHPGKILRKDLTTLA